MKLTLTLLALGAAAGVAQAQTAGTWLWRAGATQISPDVTSGNLSAPSLPGTQADISSATQLSGGITYMVNDHLAVDVPLAAPFRHNLLGAGAIAGVGKIGDVKALPVTVLMQYRFGEAKSQFRPYVGAGPTYAKFFGERGTGTLTALTNPGGPATLLSVQSKFGFTLQAGAAFQLSERWHVDLMVAKTFLKTRTTLSTGQTLDAKLDPMTFSIGIGSRF